MHSKVFVLVPIKEYDKSKDYHVSDDDVFSALKSATNYIDIDYASNMDDEDILNYADELEQNGSFDRDTCIMTVDLIKLNAQVRYLYTIIKDIIHKHKYDELTKIIQINNEISYTIDGGFYYYVYDAEYDYYSLKNILGLSYLARSEDKAKFKVVQVTDYHY